MISPQMYYNNTISYLLGGNNMPKANKALAKDMGMRIAARRRELKLTQDQAAGATGLSSQYYAKVEQGVNGIGADSLLKICEALKVSADYILTGRQISQRQMEVERLLGTVPEEKADLVIAAIRQLAAISK